MKITAIVLVAALSPAPEEQIKLPEKQAAICEVEGGCALLTKKAFDSLLLKSFKSGFVAGGKACHDTI